MVTIASRRLIVKVLLVTALLGAGVLAVLALRAGIVELDPKSMFKAMFLLIVGGALLSLIQPYLGNQNRQPLSAEPEGRN